MSLDSKLKAIFTATQADTAELTAGGRRSFPITQTVTLEFADGTTTGKANELWPCEGRTLTSGNSEDLDLYDFAGLDIGAGAGKGVFGAAMAWADVVGLLIVNREASAGNLKVGGNGTAAAWNSLFAADDDGAITLPPGGFIMAGTRNDPGWAVADGSNHLLRLAAVGGNVTFDIYLLGRNG